MSASNVITVYLTACWTNKSINVSDVSESITNLLWALRLLWPSFIILLQLTVCEPSPEVRREKRTVYCPSKCRPSRNRKYRRPERSSTRRQPARSDFLLLLFMAEQRLQRKHPHAYQRIMHPSPPVPVLLNGAHTQQAFHPSTTYSLLPFSPILLCPQCPHHHPRPTACFPLPVQHAWVAAWRWRS